VVRAYAGGECPPGPPLLCVFFSAMRRMWLGVLVVRCEPKVWPWAYVCTSERDREESKFHV
jgi:hypothetical protein